MYHMTSLLDVSEGKRRAHPMSKSASELVEAQAALGLEAHFMALRTLPCGHYGQGLRCRKCPILDFLRWYLKPWLKISHKSKLEQQLKTHS